ncbi:GMC family oxidoreductase [Advenella sp. FME57]|uniref:GMC family oxidoreductase n=1 Tax=Advenella sp. FME57 TaxID=2742604 RepID=UPI001866FB4B|nr:GMC family oxidoreductase N-terminal domain-containing protein [Advenella sp. FME57]
MQAEYDYIVAGGGAAGTVVAVRLAQQAQCRVLLLEAGKNDNWLCFRIPILVSKTMLGSRGNWRFYTNPEAGLNQRPVYFPRGKVIGGSSRINGMLWVWGNPQEYDSWSNLGISGWRFSEISKHYKYAENYQHGTHQIRGRQGNVNIVRHVACDALTRGFIDSCVDSDIPYNPDYNAGQFEGVSPLQFNILNGYRHSVKEAYLDAQKNRNLDVIYEAHVSRILFEGSRAVGVEYLQGDQRKTVRTAREVVVSAGAIQSPQILELSGIGNSARLGSLGIKPIANVPGVGENLIDHLNSRMAFRTSTRESYNLIQHSLVQKVNAALRWLAYKDGPLTNIGAMAHALVRLDDTRASLTKIQMLKLSSANNAREKKYSLDRFAGFTISSFLVHPQSRGSVHIKSADCFEKPLINANYLSSESDQRYAVQSIHKIRQIAGSAYMQALVDDEIRPGVQCVTDDEILSWIKENSLTSFHPVGTCKMGREEDGAVVDSRLRVHGVHGLRVVDASVMPTMPSSNTHAPAILVAEKGAEMILNDTFKQEKL